MKRLVRVLWLIGMLSGAALHGQTPEDQYVRIYGLIQEADALNDAGQGRAAMLKYMEAQSLLSRFPAAFPGWNENVVRFRLNYIGGRLAPLTALFPGATNQTVVPPAAATQAQPANPPVAPVAQTPAPPVQLNQTNALIRQLQDEMTRLQADNATLAAKLKEALAAQPSATDPRELAKTQEKNKNLQKENELLKVSLSQEQARTTASASPEVLAEANRSLAEAKSRMEKQEKTLESLRAENEILKKRPGAPSAKNSEEIRRLSDQLKQSREDSSSLQAQFDKLRTEKQALAAKVTDLETRLAKATTSAGEAPKADPKKVKQLQDELEKQKTAAKTAAKESQAKIEQLEQDKKQMGKEYAQLAKEKTELETKLASATSDAVKAEAKKRKQLESDLEEARARLAKTEKQLAKRDSKTIPPEVLKEMEILKARVQVLESKPAPYTAQELAALSKPQPQLVAALSGPNSSATAAPTPPVTAPAADTKPAPAKKPHRELPPGAGALAAAAQRAFAERRLDEAEQKFSEILRQDEKNPYVLGNLAAVEIEKNKVDEAEKHLTTALASDDQDDFCLYLMGRLKSMRGKQDEALNYLSQSAKLNSENPQTQNYLGIVLSEKGLRAQAEAAFRKAIQIQPDYAAAHNNLAFVYATQKPPLPALARWHYQKALDANHPRNPDLEKLLDYKP